MTVNKRWQSQKVNKVSPEKLERLLKGKGFHILDVRPRDFIKNASFIEGAYFCPLVHLEKSYTEIPKDKPLIITDWAMRQSVIAAKFLQEKDYQVFGVLKGGIERWKAENRPVEERDRFNQSELLYIPHE
jgi:rhodanese-related sulfurtransferase